MPMRSNHWKIGRRSKWDKCSTRVRYHSQHRFKCLEYISNERMNCPRIKKWFFMNKNNRDYLYDVLQAKRNKRQRAVVISRQTKRLLNVVYHLEGCTKVVYMHDDEYVVHH